MSNQTKTTKVGDASGRGSIAGYRVNFPARMRTYTEAEINAVVNVMRNAEVQTQGNYMRQFEADFKAYIGANHAFAVDNATNALKLAAILRVADGLDRYEEGRMTKFTLIGDAILVQGSGHGFANNFEHGVRKSGLLKRELGLELCRKSG